MAYRKDWGNTPQVGPQGFARTVKTIGRAVTIGTTDNVTGNTVGAFTVPPGFTVQSLYAVSSDLDSGAGMVVNIGDSAVAARLLSASALGQNTTAVTTVAAAGLLYKYTAETEILITISTQAATPVAGTITIYLTGFIDN
jgi:hypothetical protein